MPVAGAPLTIGDLGVTIPQAPSGSVPLSGSLVDNTPIGGADVGRTLRVLYPGRLEVDTGNFTTTVNAGFLEQQLHMAPGPATAFYGTGGIQHANLFASLYLLTWQSNQPLLYNATMTSGLTGTVQGHPLELSIGQDMLAHGLFYQVGLRWWAALEPLEGRANLPKNQAPWWYPKDWDPNPGP